ncbi:MAG: hypothetical protein HY660_15555 [Armatimonadetes bacterium]|nr:hypothetical protein [Armatimonadota bacterium]
MRTLRAPWRMVLMLAALVWASGVSRAAPSRPPGSGPSAPRPAPARDCAVSPGSYAMPSSIDASRKYLFYLHGKILEDQGRNAVSREHGAYCYDDIIKALADRGFVVISEIRPANTTPEYAQKVAGYVRTLLEGGVAPESITVAGFSKGGALTLRTSAVLGQPKVNFVVMAGCGHTGPDSGYRQIVEQVAPRLRGRILSIYDAADREAGPCQDAFARAPGLEPRETKFSTGLGHGLFYRPRSEWLDPVVDWAQGR